VKIPRFMERFTRSPKPVGRVDIDSIFTVSAIPQQGYVDRSERRELSRIADAITASGKSIVVLGPAKIGKSVFLHKLINEKFDIAPIELTGRSLESIDQFWLRLVIESGGYVEKSIKTKEKEQVKAKLGSELISASADLKKRKEQEITAERIFTIQSLGEQFIENFNPLIVIEDFHEIKSLDTRKEIASISKNFSEKLLAKFVFVSTSEPEIDLFKTDPQLQMRASIYPFPTWSNKELEAVVEIGFGKLKINVGSIESGRIVRESNGSPCTLNDICANAAKSAKRQAGSAWDSEITITLSARDVASALEDQVLQYTSFANIPTLALAQSRVSDRPTRYTIGAGQGTIYHLILEALRKNGMAEPHGVGRDAIRERIAEILGNKRWNSRTLDDHLAALAATDITIEHRALFGRLPEKPMHFNQDEGKFYVDDPTLRTYLYRRGTFHSM
jgi:hypothetical protein